MSAVFTFAFTTSNQRHPYQLRTTLWYDCIFFFFLLVFLLVETLYANASFAKRLFACSSNAFILFRYLVSKQNSVSSWSTCARKGTVLISAQQEPKMLTTGECLNPQAWLSSRSKMFSPIILAQKQSLPATIIFA